MKDKGEPYDQKKVEATWSTVWRQARLDTLAFAAASAGKPAMVDVRRPFYNLMMFPYPSAEGLHVGNMYAFTGSDIYGRFKRMQGFDVFEPIGLDGFGIHSENYAFKVGRHPMDQAQRSQAKFYEQLGKIGAMFDWSRTLETYDPEYYRWTQWLFVQMFKHGLAYRAKAEVNWCPSCKTVLADEQVIDGKCERCGNNVQEKLLEQWFFRITAYAEKLLENTNSLNWSKKVLVAQRNWIGKKEGINITYSVEDKEEKEVGSVTCFTTRPDTNFGATFVVLAPEHPMVASLLKSKIQNPKSKNTGNHQDTVTKKIQTVRMGRNLIEKIHAYVADAKKKSPEERIKQGRIKTGVFTGLYCVNELNNCKMPLYISDFVLMNFGTGAVVGVPGHDVRDFEFATQFDIPIKRVVVGSNGDTSAITRKEQVQEEEGTMINSGFLDGLDIHEATIKMMEYLEQKGWGKCIRIYHLRDWLISRQRYWGPPVPMIFCSSCARKGQSWFTTSEAHSVSGNPKSKVQNPKSFGFGAWDLDLAAQSAAGWYPVPEDQLPIILPRIEDYKPGDDGVAPLAKHKEFYETTCPGCGGAAVRETDVSDTFLDSSWYFLRYPSTRSARSGQSPFDPEITRHWLPVDMYTGGAEHSVLHLLYSRFVTMALHDWGHIEFEEPFTRFYAHGLVIKDGAKMSKSKGNVVNPDEYILRYGADALRLYLMFMGPFDQGGDFRDTGMEGMSRWMSRVWRLANTSLAKLDQFDKLDKFDKSSIQIALNKLVKKVTDDIEKRRYNTAIAAMMEFTNLVEDQAQGRALSVEELKTFILLLAPFAPYLSEELWQRLHLLLREAQATKQSPVASKQEITMPLANLGARDDNIWSVHVQPWPSFDASAMAEDTVTIIVQVNGKVRDTIKLKAQNSKLKSEVEKMARRSKKVEKYVEGKTVKRIIFVPGKLINVVMS